MIIKLFKYNSPNNYLNKTLIDVGTYPGTLRNESSVINPVFEIEATANLSQVNYAWIDDMHRYYYITEIVAVTQTLFRFLCHVDVLMTYKPQIKAHSAIVARQQNLFNLYLPDGESFRTQQNTMVVQKDFQQGFTDGDSYILLISGGENLQ